MPVCNRTGRFPLHPRSRRWLAATTHYTQTETKRETYEHSPAIVKIHVFAKQTRTNAQMALDFLPVWHKILQNTLHFSCINWVTLLCVDGASCVKRAGCIQTPLCHFPTRRAIRCSDLAPFKPAIIRQYGRDSACQTRHHTHTDTHTECHCDGKSDSNSVGFVDVALLCIWHCVDTVG